MIFKVILLMRVIKIIKIMKLKLNFFIILKLKV